MAIYMNDKVLEPKENGNSLEKRYFKERNEVMEMFDRFKVKGADKATILLTRDYKKKWNRSKTSYKPAPPLAMPTVANIYDQELGSIEIRYSSAPPIRVDKNLMWPRDKEASLMFETLALTSDKLDLAWFILKASNLLEKGVFTIVDSKAAFGKQFSEVILQKEVTNYIFDDDVTEEDLAKVAALFFEPNEINYEAVSGKEELAMKLITKALNDKDNPRNPGLKRLKEACIRVGLDKEKPKNEEASQVIHFEFEGEEVSADLVKAPADIMYNDILDEGKKLGLQTVGKKKDVVYSMIQYVKNNKVEA